MLCSAVSEVSTLSMAAASSAASVEHRRRAACTVRIVRVVRAPTACVHNIDNGLLLWSTLS